MINWCPEILQSNSTSTATKSPASALTDRDTVLLDNHTSLPITPPSSKQCSRVYSNTQGSVRTKAIKVMRTGSLMRPGIGFNFYNYIFKIKKFFLVSFTFLIISELSREPKGRDYFGSLFGSVSMCARGSSLSFWPALPQSFTTRKRFLAA